MGKTRLQAALDGGREIAFTILSMTVSLAAVFIPVLFMGGIIGRLFREFAVTITAAILVSGVVSVTLTPMLCSRFLREIRHDPNAPRPLFERGFAALRRSYERTLRLALRHRAFVLAVFVFVLIATGLMFKRIPTGF